MRRVGSFVTAMLVAVGSPLPGQVTCDEPERIAELPAALVEASGITRDPRRADVLWLHNDSGHRPSLYAIDLAGKLIGVASLADVPAVDLEDMAIGRCGSGWCVFLGDIGDNIGIRPFVTVYRLPLPELPRAAAGDVAGDLELPAIAPETAFTFRYPDGSRDAESLVIDDERGELVILSKGRSGEAGVYSAPLPTAGYESGVAMPLTFHGVLPVPTPEGISHQTTAADLSPDGGLLAVRTYVSLYFFDWRGAAAFDPEVDPYAVSLRSIDEPQGEGVTFALEGTQVYLASEGQRRHPPLLSAVKCTGE